MSTFVSYVLIRFRAQPYRLHGLAEHWWRASVRAVDPDPVFSTFAQTFSYRIHENVIGLFCDLVVIAQAMINEVTLPLDLHVGGDVALPINDGFLQAWVAWKCNDCVQMIWHQQAQSAIPDAFFMVVGQRCEDPVTHASATELILSRWHTFDGYKKPASFGNPLRHCMRQFFTNRQVHGANQSELWKKEKVVGSAPCRFIDASYNLFRLERAGRVIWNGDVELQLQVSIAFRSESFWPVHHGALGERALPADGSSASF